MTFEEAFVQLLLAAESDLGITKNPITQISLSPEAYDRLMYKLTTMPGLRYNYSDINASTVCGVSLRARTKESL